ncbi:MAG: hypothetical protein KDH84_07505, partial [Calditrichaeota bacterium]|nr:hypothetical protein [Calditrichota bacterium]
LEERLLEERTLLLELELLLEERLLEERTLLELSRLRGEEERALLPQSRILLGEEERALLPES